MRCVYCILNFNVYFISLTIYQQIFFTIILISENWERKPLLLFLYYYYYYYYHYYYYYYHYYKVGNERLGESDLDPISPKTPAPQCQP